MASPPVSPSECAFLEDGLATQSRILSPLAKSVKDAPKVFRRPASAGLLRRRASTGSRPAALSFDDSNASTDTSPKDVDISAASTDISPVTSDSIPSSCASKGEDVADKGPRRPEEPKVVRRPVSAGMLRRRMSLPPRPLSLEESVGHISPIDSTSGASTDPSPHSVDATTSDSRPSSCASKGSKGSKGEEAGEKAAAKVIRRQSHGLLRRRASVGSRPVALTLDDSVGQSTPSESISPVETVASGSIPSTCTSKGTDKDGPKVVSRRRASMGSRPAASSRPTSAQSWSRSRPKTAQAKKEALQLFNQELEESLRDVQDEGQLRRSASEAVQRGRRHSISGAAWKTSGACAGTVRSASLSRSNGGTTSGLFSDCGPLEGSDVVTVASKELSQSMNGSSILSQTRREEAEAVQRSGRHSASGERWKSGGACAGTVRSASLSRSNGSTTCGLFSECPPLEGSDVVSMSSKELSQSMNGSVLSQTRREEAEAKQRSQRHALSGEAWKNGGACAGTVRTASLSRTNGSTTSGLFSAAPLLEGSDMVTTSSKDLSQSMNGSVLSQTRRDEADAKQRSQRHALSGEAWKNGGACAGTVRTASLSRSHGSTTSGLFSDSGFLEGSDVKTVGSKELSQSMNGSSMNGSVLSQTRREEAEAKQRSQRHALSGEAWKNGGACAGTVRTANLSRTNGSTTSGLFSVTGTLEGSDLVDATQSKQSVSELQDEGQLRRQASEAVVRSRRHSLTGDAWKNSGACAGTVRSSSLSRTRGSTTSGLFSDSGSLAGSDSSANLRERLKEMRTDGPGGKRPASATRKSKCHAATGDAWKSSGACAGTVRAPCLSRSNGGTVSGIFSDVQPLAGSESAVNMAEKSERRRSMAPKVDGVCALARSASQPRLVHTLSEFASTDLSEDADAEAEAELDGNMTVDVSAIEQVPEDPDSADEPAPEAEMEKPAAGSALASIRAARHGGFVAGCGGA